MRMTLKSMLPGPVTAALRPLVRAARGVRQRFRTGTHSGRRPPRGWLLLQLLLAGSRSHAFLDRRYVGPLLASLPGRYRRGAALRLLGLSPHYWVYQWCDLYPAEFTRSEVLWAEFHRNERSRIELADKLLKPYLPASGTALDFGCGPGFLARGAARHAGRVIGVDVSRGVLACAQALNPAPNLRYVRSQASGMPAVGDRSIDLLYSFAVFQHVLKADARAIFAEFARVLAPGGVGLCHMILKEPGETRLSDPSEGGWVRRRVMLRMVYYTRAEVAEVLRSAGFENITIRRIAEIVELDDDIGNEFLVEFRKPASRE